MHESPLPASVQRAASRRASRRLSLTPLSATVTPREVPRNPLSAALETVPRMPTPPPRESDLAPPSSPPVAVAPRATLVRDDVLPTHDRVAWLVEASRQRCWTVDEPLTAEAEAGMRDVRVETVLANAHVPATYRAGFFLARHFLLMRPFPVIDWLTEDGRDAPLLAFVTMIVHFRGLDLELAFRRFLQRIRALPSEGQKQTRLLEAFAQRFYFDNAAAGWFADSAAVCALTTGLFMLQTMLHNAHVPKKAQFDEAAWVEHNAQRNAGADFDGGMLSDLFHCVQDDEITIEESGERFPRSIKHGWLMFRPAAARRPRRVWCEVSDGVMYLLRCPGPPKSATTLLPLDYALVARCAEDLTFSVERANEAGVKETVFFTAASMWAWTTWLRAVESCADRPFPGVPVHDVPSAGKVTRRKSMDPLDLSTVRRKRGATSARGEREPAVVKLPSPPAGPVQVANPVFKDARVSQRLRASLSSPDLRTANQQVRVVPNPVFVDQREEPARVENPIFVPRRSSAGHVSNPVFGNEEVMQTLLSPRTLLLEVENPLFGLGPSLLYK